MNSLPAFSARQTTVHELAQGDSIRVGRYIVTVAEIVGGDVKVFVERLAEDDVEDSFQFEDLSELLATNYETV